jgi:hypothetical protein
VATSITVTDHWTDGRRITGVGTITFSGSYTTGGDSISFADSSGLLKIGGAGLPVSFCQIAGQGLYLYEFINGTSPTAGNKIKIISLATQLELGSGAYPSGVTSDTVTFEVVAPQFV